MSDLDDQFRFDDAVKRYDRVDPPVQHQPEPGLQIRERRTAQRQRAE